MGVVQCDTVKRNFSSLSLSLSFWYTVMAHEGHAINKQRLATHSFYRSSESYVLGCVQSRDWAACGSLRVTEIAEAIAKKLSVQIVSRSVHRTPCH